MNVIGILCLLGCVGIFLRGNTLTPEPSSMISLLTGITALGFGRLFELAEIRAAREVKQHKELLAAIGQKTA